MTEGRSVPAGRTHREWSTTSAVLALWAPGPVVGPEVLLPLAAQAPLTFLSLRPVGHVPARALDALAQHPDAAVRALLASRQDLPDDVASVLAMDDDADVLAALIANPLVDDLLVHGVVAWRGSPAVRAAYERRTAPSLPEPQAGEVAGSPGDVLDHRLVDDRAEEEWPPWFGRGPVPAGDTAPALAEFGWSPGLPLSDACEELVIGLVRRTQDLDLLQQMAVAVDPDLRAAAADNSELPEHLVVRLSVDDDLDVRLSALTNPRLPVDLLEEALRDAEELFDRGQYEADGYDLVHRLGWSPALSPPMLERLLRLGSSGAALRMLLVPAQERPDLPDSTLLSRALEDGDRLPLHLTPLHALPIEALVALADVGHLRPADVVDSMVHDPRRFDDLVDETLGTWGRPWDWDWDWHLDDWPTLIADSPGCSEHAAALLLQHHSHHERALRSMLRNEALSVPMRVAALAAYGNLDHDVSGMLVPERAGALGRAVLATGLPPAQLVQLADLIDERYGDALHATSSTSTEDLVAAALRDAGRAS